MHVHNVDYLLMNNDFWVDIARMIAHEHGDVKFVHYALNLYPAYSNHMIGLFARFLRDFEKPPSYSSRLLFENMGSTPLYEMVLDGKDVCSHS